MDNTGKKKTKNILDVKRNVRYETSEKSRDLHKTDNDPPWPTLAHPALPQMDSAHETDDEIYLYSAASES